LFGFSLTSSGRLLSPRTYGIWHQRRPFLHLRPVDINRWKLASQAIDHHVWYNTDTKGQKNLRVDFMDVDFLALNLVTIRVPNHPKNFMVLDDWLLFSGMTIACAIYGGLHLVAWNAPFPTRMEKLLWRISGVGVASFGPVYLPLRIGFAVGRLFTKIKRSKDHRIRWNWWRSPSTDVHESGFVIIRILVNIWVMWLALCVGCYLPLYVFSRVYLIVECFINIAHLPESVFRTPDWSQYFPHIN